MKKFFSVFLILIFILNSLLFPKVVFAEDNIDVSQDENLSEIDDSHETSDDENDDEIDTENNQKQDNDLNNEEDVDTDEEKDDFKEDIQIINNVGLENITQNNSGNRNIILEGSCGENATFVIYDDGTMIIDGYGEITGFNNQIYNELSSVESLSIYGVSSIKIESFNGFSSLRTVFIGDSVTQIEITDEFDPGNYANFDSAFKDCLSIIVSDNNPIYDSRNNCNAIIETVTNTLLRACRNTIIPDSVTTIGDAVFADCNWLTSITIPDSVKTIGTYSFSFCNSLQSIIMGDSLTSIGNCAFEGCVSLTSIAFPDSVSTIGTMAFYGCASLTSINIPNSLAILGGGAFGQCPIKLQSIIIGDSFISGAAYIPRGNATSIIVSENNPVYDSRNNCNAIIETATNTLIKGCINTTIPNSITSIGSSAFFGCTGLTSINIPDSVTSIGDYAFDAYNLINIFIPKSVNYIGELWFESDLVRVYTDASPNNNLWNEYGIEFPMIIYNTSRKTYNRIIENELSIEDYGWCGDNVGYTIYNDNSMIISGEGEMYDFSYDNHPSSWDELEINYIIINEGITSIGTNAFSSLKNLKTVVIPNTVTTIGDEAFRDCSNLTSITIPYSVTTIGGYAFSGCTGLTSIYIPDSVTSIGIVAFTRCSGLTSISVSENNPAYDSRESCNAIIETASNTLIAGCMNTIIPNTVSSIGTSAFNGCFNLKSITIPDSVTTIGEYAFSGCTGLTSIYIPDSVTFLAEPGTTLGQPFIGCSSLKSITVSENNPVYDSRDNCNAIIETENNALISGCMNTIIPNTVTYIGIRAFEGCESLVSITIPNSVTEIDIRAFCNCTSLESIVFEGIVPYYNNVDYYGCSSLKKVSIPEHFTTPFYINLSESSSVIDIETVRITKGDGSYIDNSSNYNHTFWYKHKETIKEIIFEEGVTFISNKMLYELNNVETLVLPSSLECVEEGAFSGLTGLKNLTIPVSLDITNLFSDNINLESITFVSSDDNVINYDDSNYQQTPWHKSDVDKIKIVFEEGITSIGDYMFKDLANVKSITIPSTVTRIGSEAFSGCSNIESLTMPLSSSFDSTSFEGVSNLRNIQLTAGNGVGLNYNTNNYQNTPWYRSKLNNMKVVLDDGITSIGSYTFYNCTGITSINVPDSVDHVGYYAFYGLDGLSSIFVPGSIDEIEQYAFANIENVYTSAKSKRPNWHNLWAGSGSNVHYNVSEQEYHKLTDEMYDIIFYGNGATSGNTEKMSDLTQSESYQLNLNNFTRTGYIFTGWNTEMDGSGYGYEDGETISNPVLENNLYLNLYAQWRPITYTVIYHSGLDNVDSVQDMFAYDEEKQLAGNIFVVDDNQLIGWNSEKDLSGTSYELEEVVMNLCETDGAVIELYAIWNNSTLEPYADPDQGDIDKGTKVSLYSDTLNADIYYTLDGTDPDRTSTLYTGPVVIENDTTIKAIAVSDNLPESKVVAFVYTVLESYDYGTINPDDIDLYEQLGKPTGFWMSDMVYDIENPEEQVYYTGNKVTLSFRVYHGNNLLNEGRDYTVKYSNNVKVASKDDKKAPTVTITGKGNYVGSITKTFDILPISLNEDNTVVLLNKDSFICNNRTQKPTVTIEYQGAKLKNNTDYTLTYENGASSIPGQYKLTIEGKGNYEGTLEREYVILNSDATLKLISSLSISSVSNQTYTGEEIYPSITIKDKKTVLIQDEDYTATFINNTNVGKAYILLEGNEANGYTGSIIKSFKINPVKLTAKNCEVTGLESSYDYVPNEAIKPSITVEYDGEGLNLNKDYIVTYKNNDKAGTATITYKGINNYSGSFNKSFKINRLDLEEYMFDFDSSYDYNKGGVKAIPDTDLVLNKDYTLSYKNNNKLGTCIVTVKGKGNYSGSLTYEHEIETKNLHKVSISVGDKVVSTKNNGWKSNPVLTDESGKKLIAGTDYDKNILYTYRFDTTVLDGSSKEKQKPELQRYQGDTVEASDIIPAGTYIDVTVTTENCKSNNYDGDKSTYYRIVAYDLSKATASIPVQYYTGKPITVNKSDITVKVNKQILKSTDFEIVSYSNNTASGKATVTIRGKGNYGGTKTVNFTIAKKQFSLSSLLGSD